MLGEKPSSSGVSGRFKGTRPDYGSYFILKNVSDAY